MFRNKFVLMLIIIAIGFSCKSKSARQLEYEKVKAYVPKSLNSHGFVLPISSKIPEVHQLSNDLQANFFFYKNKDTYEKTVDRIIELDPEYASAYLMKSFYETDTIVYKKLVTKAYNLSKKLLLDSERYMVQADYYLLIEEDYEKSREYFQKVADMYPNSAIAIWCVGMTYYYGGEIDKAMECYKKSIMLIPNLPKGYEFIAGVHYKRKAYKEALSYIKKAKEHGANAKNDIYFSEFENFIYYRNELYEKTIESVEKAYTFGEKYKTSDNLNKVYKLAKSKQDSIKSLKL